ncbi:MAG TPA: hypothetical protein VN915_01700 [Elusimicrobiota bacterium]|nr:hypothetical protein [Elusimicrobiota bacterium]
MKSLASALALALLIPASAFAQTFVQNYHTKAGKVSDAIKSSGLNADLKASFEGRLAKINEKVCGQGFALERFIGSPTLSNCPGISTSKVEDANDALDALSDDLADAIKKDAGKTEAQLYAPKLALLKQKVQSSKIDKDDQKALLDRIDNFDKGNALKGMTTYVAEKGEKGAKGDAAKLDEKFQKLSDDVDAAIDLAKDKAEAEGFAKAFQSKADALKTKISGSKLAAPIQQDFQSQLTAIEKAACEPAAGAKRPAGLSAGIAEKAAKGVCRGTPSSLDKGTDALATLSDGVDEAIKADGAKSLADIYKPQTAALKTKLTKASVDRADMDALNKRIDDFTKSLEDIKNDAKVGALAGKPALRGRKTEDAVQTAADTFQKLSDDVDAAVALAQANKGSDSFYTDLQKQLTALDAKVKATKLDPAFKSDFDARAAKIVADVCPTAAGRKGFDMKGCDKAAPSKISAAQTALDKLSDDVDAAAKSDGTETLAAVYKPKLAALKTQLTKSRVSSENQKPLLKRIDSFDSDILSKATSRIRGEKKVKGSEDEVQKASDLYDALAADVAAAIKLSPMSKADAAALNVKVVQLAGTIAGNGILDAKTKADFAKRTSALEAQLKGSPLPNPDDANDAYNAINNDYQSALQTAAAAKTPAKPLQ